MWPISDRIFSTFKSSEFSFSIVDFTMLFSTLCGFLVVGQTLAQSSTVDAYVASQSPLAKAGLLANIGPSGSKSMGAKSGIVVASPSNVNPDYLYTWTRDSALVFQTIIDQ